MGAPSERPRPWQIFDRAADRIMHVIVFAGICIVFSVIGLLLLGFRSNSTAYWLIAIIAFPVLCTLGEGVVDLLGKIRPIANARAAVEVATKGKAFSGLRVLYRLTETVVFLVLVLCLWFLGKGIVGKWLF